MPEPAAQTPQWPLAVEAAGPPPNLVLQPGILLIGTARPVRMTGAPSAVNGGLLATTRQSGAPSCPPQLAPRCLDLPAPTLLLGTARSNASGTFTFSVTVPASVPEGTVVRLQGAVPAAGVGAWLSNVQTMEVWDPAVDHDEDGLLTGAEVAGGTDPFLYDTDGDGFADGDEVDGGFNPLDPFDAPECSRDEDCDDGVFCTGVEGCVSGRCETLSTPNVDDGLLCTVDDCDPATDAPRHVDRVCDDSDATTYDACQPDTGCVHLSACEAGQTAQAPGVPGAQVVCVPPGTFTMGCVSGRDQVPGASCFSEESPPHSVELTRSFWMMRAEMDQGQYTALLGGNPSYNRTCGPNCPVETVMFWDALRAANAASAVEGLPACYALSNCTGTPNSSYSCTLAVTTPSGSPYDCTGYRLPTEAEWERAARGGEAFAFAGSNTVTTVGWTVADGPAGPIRPVCQKTPNAYGLCDMTGNVFEWVWDGSSFYTSAAATDPIGMAFAGLRVYRGGGKSSQLSQSRVAYRPWQFTYYRANDLGIRLVRTAFPDTDGDGIQDRDEIERFGTEPLAADTDGDGLSDGLEVNTLGTDPLRADTDGDGVDDGTEITNGTDPLTAQDVCLAAMDNTTSSGLGGATMRCLPPATFTMGCVPGRDDVVDPCPIWESPSHSVELTHPVWMMESEVTEAHWQALMGSLPPGLNACSGSCPVAMVNWWDAAAFANAVSTAEGLLPCYNLTGCTGTPGSGAFACAGVAPTAPSIYECEGYRLPTEAEWEYAARGGESFAYAGSSSADAVAWYFNTSGLQRKAVCTRADNAFGLCDLSGNVEEWCSDGGLYPSSPQTDPVYESSIGTRAARGGEFFSSTFYVRVASRREWLTDSVFEGLGFRLVRTAD